MKNASSSLPPIQFNADLVLDLEVPQDAVNLRTHRNQLTFYVFIVGLEKSICGPIHGGPYLEDVLQEF
jgi:hypothetical protein